MDDGEKRNGFGQDVASCVQLLIGYITGDVEDDSNMEDDCDVVRNKEEEEEEAEPVDLLDLELVNCCMRGMGRG